MPTNEERRDVARKLRELSKDTEEVSDFDLARTLELETVSRYGYAPEDVDRLADLIEPEPERTCRMTKIGGDRILAGWWECSECGPVYPPCRDEIAIWSLQRCPRCGAKVVGE